jgi:hypothetical protein
MLRPQTRPRRRAASTPTSAAPPSSASPPVPTCTADHLRVLLQVLLRVLVKPPGQLRTRPAPSVPGAVHRRTGRPGRLGGGRAPRQCRPDLQRRQPVRGRGGPAGRVRGAVHSRAAGLRHRGPAPEQAARVADRIEAGLVCVFVNGVGTEGAELLPLGREKRSGLGRELDRLGTEEFTDRKRIRTPAGPRRVPRLRTAHFEGRQAGTSQSTWRAAGLRKTRPCGVAERCGSRRSPGRRSSRRWRAMRVSRRARWAARQWCGPWAKAS